MGEDKTKKELEKLAGLVFVAPVILQGAEVIKARKDTAKLQQITAGTLKLGVIGTVGLTAFELAANPFGKMKKKKKMKMKRR